MHVSVLEDCELTWGIGRTETIPWISCKLEQEHLPVPALICGGHAVSSPCTCFSSKHSPQTAVNLCSLSLQFLVQTVLWLPQRATPGPVSFLQRVTLWWQWWNHLRGFQKFHSHTYSSPRPLSLRWFSSEEKSHSNRSIITKQHLLEPLLSAGHCLKCLTWGRYNPNLSAKANET